MKRESPNIKTMGMVEQKLTSLKLQRVFNLTIILFLIVLSVISLDFIRNRVKDTKRRADIKQLQTALAVYQDRFGHFPDVTDKDFRGWDATYEPLGQPQEFLSILEEKKIIDHVPRDPINSEVFFYRYRKFPANTYGCQKPFYVLQIMNLEGNHKDHGYGSCPERNFVNEAPNGYTIQVSE